EDSRAIREALPEAIGEVDDHFHVTGFPTEITDAGHLRNMDLEAAYRTPQGEYEYLPIDQPDERPAPPCPPTADNPSRTAHDPVHSAAVRGTGPRRRVLSGRDRAHPRLRRAAHPQPRARRALHARRLRHVLLPRLRGSSLRGRDRHG